MADQATTKILWKSEAPAIQSTQVLVVYNDVPFLVGVPDHRKNEMIKGDNLVIDVAILFGANPIKQWCPIRSPYIR